MKITTPANRFKLSAKPLLALLLALPLAFSACSDDDEPEPEEDNELITTVTYALTPAAGSTAPAATITWEDLDGAGGAAPVITGGPLALRAGTTYTGTITLLDKTKTPAANITDEVAKEKDDHLFIYEPAPAGAVKEVLAAQRPGTARAGQPAASSRLIAAIKESTSASVVSNEHIQRTSRAAWFQS